MSLSGVRQEYLYLCIQEMHKDGYAIAEICDILQLNRSSYYNWTHRVKSNRETENEDLLHEIGLIYAEHNGTYGYRRIADEYNATHKKRYNLKRFYRLVHIVGLLAVIRRKRPAYQRSTPEVTAENILNRDFTATKVNEKWCTDVTGMKYGSDGEKAYLSAILDLKGRDIVSFAIGKSTITNLYLKPLIWRSKNIRMRTRCSTVTADSNIQANSSRPNWTSRRWSKVCPGSADVSITVQWKASGVF